MKKGTVLITGGAGFIGSHTADAFRAKGFRVRILDALLPPVHNGTWPSYVKGKGFELMRGDVRLKAVWVRALKGVSFVYHLAAYQDQRSDFSTFFETNTVSTALLYEVAVAKHLPIKKIILASSQFVYGDGRYSCPHSGKEFYPELRTQEQLQRKEWDIRCPHPPESSRHSSGRAGGAPARFRLFREDQPVIPTNSYGLSKVALEQLAMRLGKTYGIPTTAFRYSVVQGERQSPRNLYSGALRIFVTQALRGKPITVYEDGRQRRDFVNVHDVVRANLLPLTTSRTDFGVFNVGGGKAYTVLAFAKLAQEMARSRSKIVVEGFRRTDTRNAVSDISKIKKLGWHPRFSPKKSVEDYIRWYKGNSVR